MITNKNHFETLICLTSYNLVQLGWIQDIYLVSQHLKNIENQLKFFFFYKCLKFNFFYRIRKKIQIIENYNLPNSYKYKFLLHRSEMVIQVKM